MGTNLINYNELLLQRQFNKDIVPSAEVVCLKIQDKVIGTIGNYIVFSGLPKTGKSTFIAATISSSLLHTEDTNFGIKLTTYPHRPIVAYFDTESSAYDNYQQIQKICKLGLRTNLPDNIRAYNTREDTPEIIIKLIETFLDNTPTCSILFLDGLLDACYNYNDETETRKLTNWLKKITKIYNILVVTVLHTSKGSFETLGHLGSNTDRWAQSTLTVEKDKITKQMILKPKFLRSSDDFEPIAINYINGQWRQTHFEQQVEITKKKK